jgi:hypothetical protein
MEKAKAIVNGIVGDHLDETDNELATVMAFYDRPQNGNPIALSSLLFDAATTLPRRSIARATATCWQKTLA